MRGSKLQKAMRFIDNKRKPLLFAVGFAAIGVIALFSVRAAVTTTNFEAESGTPFGSASVVSNTQASSGSAIKFGNTANVDIASDAKPLPFDMPTNATLKAAPKKVFAHYFTAYPIKINNVDPASDYYETGYLNPNGESGKHAAYGGLLRERPLPEPQSALSTWQYDNMKKEVQRATQAGLDGFTVDMLGLANAADTKHWSGLKNLLKASAEVDPKFKIVLMPDATTGVVNDPAYLASSIAELVNDPVMGPQIQRSTDGKIVIAPFKPEGGSTGAAWWQNWITIMKTNHGIDVAFLPCFLSASQTNVDAFKAFSIGFSDWGSRSPYPTYTDALNGSVTKAQRAHSLGKIWMQPVSVQDNRPNQGNYFEAQNTDNLRVTWQAAIDTDAEWIQIPTWNDYSENAQIAPSTHIGWSPLDISSYYLHRYKLGNYPQIKRDVLYVSHRIQPFAALPTGSQTKLMLPRDGTAKDGAGNPIYGSEPPRDTVEVLSMLAAPGKVTVTIGGTPTTYDAPAGVYVKTFALGLGTISAKAVRTGSNITTANVTSPFTVVARPVVQDLQYYFVSSSRDGSL